jgi:hypothetical protein
MAQPRLCWFVSPLLFEHLHMEIGPLIPPAFGGIILLGLPRRNPCLRAEARTVPLHSENPRDPGTC